MARTFFTADWHLGDPRIELLGRPFADTEEMAQRVLAEHNRVISPNDTVYMLGDALHAGTDAYLEHIGLFNGHMTLIRGNHDVLDDDRYAPYFERVIAEGDGVELDVGGLPCWLTHYPTRARADRFNLVAHVHGAWRVQKNTLNCGIDAHFFRPVSVAQVRFFYDAICGVYDRDVWAADHPANAAHAQRGKPGSYLDRPLP